MGLRCLWKVLLLLLTMNVFGQQRASSQQLQEWLSLATEYRFNKPDTARFYCQQVLAEARQTGQKEIEAEALRIISISYEAQGDYKEGLDYGLKSLALWRDIGDPVKIANTLNSVGIIYDQQGIFYEALRYYNEAYAIYAGLDDDEHLAMMNVNLGILFKSQGQYEQVLRHYRDAYAIYNRLNLPAEIAFCEANLGSVYYYIQQYDSCVYYSLKAERALLEQKNLQFMPVAQANAGIGYLALGKLNEAKSYLQKALKAHKQYGNKKETSFVLIHLARLYTQQNREKETYQSLREAKELALSIKSPQQVMEASKLLADYYFQFGEYKNAYNEFADYSSIKDTLFEQQKTREITNHQVRYETARKEQEITLLTQKNEIQQLDIRQQNLYLIIASLLITGAIVTSWQLYRTKKIKEDKLRKEAAMQAELLRLESQNTLQTDRLRISRDLHDNIGANLTFIHTTVDEIANEDRKWEDIKCLVNETITELRRTVWLINKPSVKLDEWIIKLREYYKKIDKVEICLQEMVEEGYILSSKQATGLFRIVQEATNNSLKYAEAQKISIEVQSNDMGMAIHIKDNGKGFSLEKISKGFGLDNMQLHVEEIAGTLQIDSIEGKGTVVSVTIDLLKNT